MLDWLDAIPNLDAPEHRDGTPRGTPGTPAGTPQNTVNPLKIKEEHREHPEHRKKGVPSAILRDWHEHLSTLDDLDPPTGYDLNWWTQAVRDACWIYENFASGAVRAGWSAHDLFGILPWHPGWGGLCDRLRGARNLKMEVDGRKAVWSSWRVQDWTCAGAGDDLITSGLTLIWELGNKAA